MPDDLEPAEPIVALDSSSYLEPHPTGPTDVIVVGSYCGTRILAPMFIRGVKAVIATDAGIAKNNSAVEGVKLLGERGIPAAAAATMSARLGEGLSTWNDGVISVVNPVAEQRGVKLGITAKEAARLML